MTDKEQTCIVEANCDRKLQKHFVGVGKFLWNPLRILLLCENNHCISKGVRVLSLILFSSNSKHYCCSLFRVNALISTSFHRVHLHCPVGKLHWYDS